jgi:hypothetical protein
MNGGWLRNLPGVAMILAMASLFAPVPAEPNTVSVDAGYFAASRPQIIAAQALADPQPSAATGQRAVLLLDADQRHPQGRRFSGTVTWRTETVSPGPGMAPELVVRADIKIPERNMAMTWSLSHNADRTLAVSHFIEVMFNLPSDFPGGGISNLPGILMKDSEDGRGTPLAGLAVLRDPADTNHFVVVLSDAEMKRNEKLLKKRTWFDTLIVYRNGHRAIVSVEKGPTGERAFADAFVAWGN